jgi:tripartite-type tricarboxylate transporter receptor subunit TctC
MKVPPRSRVRARDLLLSGGGKWRAAAALALMMASGAHAAPAADFYKGRTIFITVGYSAGGGYDLYARVLAQHLGKHIPGNPSVVPQNMPGAGSIKAAAYVFTAAPKDGTVIGTFARGMASSALLGQANFDARKFTWLGSMTKDVTLCISWGQSQFKTWNDVMAKQFTAGGEGAAGDPDIFAKLYKNVFGAKIRLATGFPGTTDITLAMQRREVDGLCGISWSTVKSRYGAWVKEKKINILLQAAPMKAPDLPDVPLASDLAKTMEQRQMLDYAVASEVLARPFVAPPGIPADRAAILRAGFDATLKDPAFLADAEKTMIDIDPVNAKEAEEVVASLYALPKDVIQKAARAIGN